MLCNQTLQIGEDLAVPTDLKVELEAVLHDRQPFLLQAKAFASQQWAWQTGERLASPGTGRGQKQIPGRGQGAAWTGRRRGGHPQPVAAIDRAEHALAAPPRRVGLDGPAQPTQVGVK